MESQAVREPNTASVPRKAVVLPGEEIAVGTAAAGPGTYSENGKVFAAILGLRIEYKGVVSVVPLSGVYSPRQGDAVIGHVIDLGPSNWTVDVRTSSPAPLHVNDVPWRVDFGDTARYINVGETILCKVLKIDEVRRVFLTLSGPGLRKLEGGEVVEIQHTVVGRVVGKNGATLEKLKRWTNCRIYAAANGRVWVDGDLPDMMVGIAAVKLIEREAHKPNLSQLLDDYLRTHGREPKPEETTGAGFEEAGAEAPPRAAGFAEAEDEAEVDEREKKAKEEE
jgi:exosome complex component RRP4